MLAAIHSDIHGFPHAHVRFCTYVATQGRRRHREDTIPFRQQNTLTYIIDLSKLYAAASFTQHACSHHTHTCRVNAPTISGRHRVSQTKARAHPLRVAVVVVVFAFDTRPNSRIYHTRAPERTHKRIHSGQHARWILRACEHSPKHACVCVCAMCVPSTTRRPSVRIKCRCSSGPATTS